MFSSACTGVSPIRCSWSTIRSSSPTLHPVARELERRAEAEPGLDGDHEQIDQLGHGAVDSVEAAFGTLLDEETRSDPADRGEEDRGEERQLP
jgi:hypothetical protein